jgi:hypothetical protein
MYHNGGLQIQWELIYSGQKKKTRALDVSGQDVRALWRLKFFTREYVLQ